MKTNPHKNKQNETDILAAANAEIEALKQQNKQTQALIRYLANAVALTPVFMLPQQSVDAMELARARFEILLKLVLAKT
jgi:hypothetical protein